MKSAIAFALFITAAQAFNAPLMATRAVGKKAAPAPASTAKSTPPPSRGYPTIDLSNIKFNISGGGNRAPPAPLAVPDFSDPKLQIERDPAFYAAAAATRLTKAKSEFVYEDGLTEIERKQRSTIPAFLTGSAKSQADSSTIRDDIVAVDYFGLSPDRFQLLFISVFGVFTLVGCLSGNLKL